MLDPLPRWVSADVLTTGDLLIGGATVPGEGTHARDVQRLLLAGTNPRELADAGVGWVVAESGGAPTISGLPVAYADSDVTLYRVGGDHPPASHRGLLIAMHMVWLATLIAGAAGAAAAMRRVRRVAHQPFGR